MLPEMSSRLIFHLSILVGVRGLEAMGCSAGGAAPNYLRFQQRQAKRSFKRELIKGVEWWVRIRRNRSSLR